MKQVGRPAQEIRYVHVNHDGKEYTVGLIRYKGLLNPFVIDREDYDLVSKTGSWHVTANNYISTNIVVDEKRKSLYLHNIVLDRHSFDGRGQTETVDHISRNGFDNRKENLRLATQSEQNINQKRKPRTAILPADCGLTPADIPKHIWYVKANGGHGDRFAIEFKSEGLLWRSTSSKTTALCDKLAEAKAKLSEFYVVYPHLNPAIQAQQINQLNASFRTIVATARS